MANCIIIVEGKTIANKVGIALGSSDRSIGLLGRKTLDLQEGVMWEVPGFRSKIGGYWNAIHMVGMKFPIAVAWVGRGGHIIKSVVAELPSLRNPLGWYSSPLPATHVVELHAAHYDDLKQGAEISWRVY